MTDEELVIGCVSKDPAAQKLLFERFSRKMMGVCLRYADRSEEADDMLQNGFIRVFEKIGTFGGIGSLEGWIRKIVVNESLTYLRKNKAMKLNLNIDEEKYMVPGNSHVGESMNEKDLLKMIQQLPTGFRTVFNLYAIEGYSHKEIGKRLGISEGTSKSQYSRARVHLQNMLRGEAAVLRRPCSAIAFREGESSTKDEVGSPRDSLRNSSQEETVAQEKVIGNQ